MFTRVVGDLVRVFGCFAGDESRGFLTVRRWFFSGFRWMRKLGQWYARCNASECDNRGHRRLIAVIFCLRCHIYWSAERLATTIFYANTMRHLPHRFYLSWCDRAALLVHGLSAATEPKQRLKLSLSRLPNSCRERPNYRTNRHPSRTSVCTHASHRPPETAADRRVRLSN